VLKKAKKPLIILGKGAAYAQADSTIRDFVEKSGIPFLPMSMAKGLLPDTHPQCAGAARSLVLKESDVVVMVGARLNWLLSHGKGKSWGEPGSKQFIQIDIEPREMDSNVEIAAPLVGDIGSCAQALLDGMQNDWPAPPVTWIDAVKAKVEANVARMSQRLGSDTNPMDYHTALAAAAIETGKPVLAIEGDSAFGFSGMEVETICRYNLPVCVVVFNNNGIYRGTDVNPTGGSDVAPTVFVKDSRYDLMMQAFGGVGVHATTRDELTKAVNEAMDSGKPTMINAVIDENAGTESGRIGNLNPQSVVTKKS